MNKARRKELSKAVEMLRDVYSIIESCKDDEEEAYDNLPESFQDGERGDEMQEYIDIMDEALDQIDEAANAIEEIV